LTRKHKGTWVHGHNPSLLVNDRTPLTNPTPLTAFRPAHEQNVVQVSADIPVEGIVIRPSLLYGRSGSILSWLFGLAGEGKEIVWPGKQDCRWSVIHTDDLARLFVSVAEAVSLIN
jgi:nucleoside-diphosphate-sugar epimerase